MLDTFFGLPFHPLLVHLPVVLLPLSAVGVIALAFRSEWRSRFAIPVLGLAALGSLSTVLAMLSGNALAERVGLPAQHQQVGVALVVTALVYLVIAGAWLWWVRRDDVDATPTQNIAGAFVGIMALAVSVLTFMVGHSGATAVWGEEGKATPAPASSASPTPVATTTSSASSTPSETPSAGQSTSAAPITYEVIAQHNTADDCWAAINGSAYNLTDWIAQHPGGPDRIIALCGTDATNAFLGQHSGQDKPDAKLAQFFLGPIS